MFSRKSITRFATTTLTTARTLSAPRRLERSIECFFSETDFWSIFLRDSRTLLIWKKSGASYRTWASKLSRSILNTWSSRTPIARAVASLASMNHLTTELRSSMSCRNNLRLQERILSVPKWSNWLIMTVLLATSHTHLQPRLCGTNQIWRQNNQSREDRTRQTLTK